MILPSPLCFALKNIHLPTEPLARKVCCLLTAWLLCSLLIPITAQRQDAAANDWTPGVYMQQATNNIFEKASLLNALSEYSWRDELCLAGALLSVGETIALDVELEQGKSYTFIGGGDEDIHDLDLYVVSRNEEVVAQDVEADDTPIPDFVAPYTGRYSIRMQLVSGDAQTSFVALALLSQEGTSLEEQAYNELSDKFFNAGGSVHSVSSGVKWHDLKNQWSVFGVLLDDDSSWELENLRLGDLSHFIFASAGPEVKNLDLLLKEADGKPVAEDQDNDAYPVLETTTRADCSYSVKVSNVRSNGRSLILMGIVTL